MNAARPSGSRVSLTSMGLRAESRQRSASIFSSSTPLRQSVLNFVVSEAFNCDLLFFIAVIF